MTRKKENIFLLFFLFGKTKSFACVPVRDQNHVVPGKKNE